MQQVKQTAEYTIFQKKSGRYAVKGKDKRYIRAEDKTRILLAEQLITQPEPKAAAPAAEPETAPEAETAAEA